MHEINTRKLVGDLLKETRKNKGLLQTDVAACMGIDFQVVSDYENGRRNPSVEWLFRACDCLQVDFGEFMKELDERRKVAENKATS